MLHLRNQRLYARENRIPGPSPIETYRCPISYGKVWFFDFHPSFSALSLSLSPIPGVPHPFSPCDFPRSPAHLRSQELVRPQRNGRSVAFWTRACSQEDREEKFTSRLNLSSPSLVHSTLLFFDWFKFSDFVPFRCPCNHLSLGFGRTCPCAVSEILHAIPIRQTNP